MHELTFEVLVEDAAIKICNIALSYLQEWFEDVRIITHFDRALLSCLLIERRYINKHFGLICYWTNVKIGVDLFVNFGGVFLLIGKNKLFTVEVALKLWDKAVASHLLYVLVDEIVVFEKLYALFGMH